MKPTQLFKSGNQFRAGFLFCFTVLINLTMVYAQQNRTIQGKVTDNQGLPLPGVNIVVENTNNGTLTDFDGNYTLKNVTVGAVISMSYVGFTTQEFTVSSSSSTINATLSENTEELNEVVVIGYGSVKKSDLTGAVSSIKADDLNPGSAVPNVDQLLIGKMAGVQINQNSGEPGGGVNVRIRGASSINAGNEPLYVIDGLPIDNSPPITGDGAGGIANNRNARNPLNMINPNDIESIEVLKDASATAIYGSRGANGVIMITTKKGTDERININYNTTLGIQEIANKVDVLGSGEFATIVNDIAEKEGRNPIYDLSEVTEYGSWLDEITRSGYIQSHNLAVSGGGQKSNFYTSLNAYQQDGIIISSGLERLTGRLNAEFKPSDKFTYGLNLTNSYIKNDNVPNGTGFNASGGVVNLALQYDPTLPHYNEDGSRAQSFEIDLENPLIVSDILTEEVNTRLLGNVYAEYQIINGLRFKVNLGLDRLNARKDTYVPSYTKNGINRGSGVGTIITGEQSSKLLETTLNYSKEIKKHNFNLLAGYTTQSFTNRGFSGNIDGFISDVLLTNNFGLGSTENDNLNSYKNSNKLISYLGRANYIFDGKYYATASFRADGSSRFGENNKYGFFPSAALAWKISEESFLRDNPAISNLKLRASWGQIGNQSIGNYQSLSTLGAGPTAIIGDQYFQGIKPTRIPNPDLKWETTAQLDIGFDLTLFDGKINFVADYFEKTTDDLLLDLPLPVSSGFSSILTNIGQVKNNGIELFLETRNFSSTNFNWKTTITFTKIKNEVTDIGGVEQILQGDLPFTSGITVIRKGLPLNSYYGHVVDGIFQEGDDIANSAQPNAMPGYPRFRDISGPDGVPDGAITDADKTELGSPFPDFSFGIGNSLSYKRWTMDIFIAGDIGQELLNQNLLFSLYPIEVRRNRLAEPLLNRWTPENPTNRWPSGVNSNSYGGSTVNSLSIEDATFVRLRNLRVGYNINTDKIGLLNSANVFVEGTNLLLITDYLGFDPEVNSFDSRAGSARVDYNGYPNARTISLGFQFNF